jgi:hypothetical protein
MVRSKWKRTLISTLAWAGMGLGQLPGVQASTPVNPVGRVMTVREQGKPGQKCKVLRTWVTSEGTHAYEVQAVATGEIMTIVEARVPAGEGGPRALATRIYHWGRNGIPPEGTPMPPPAVVQTAAPAPDSDSSARTVAAGTEPPSFPAAPPSTPPTTPPKLVAESQDSCPQPLPVGVKKKSAEDAAEMQQPEAPRKKSAEDAAEMKQPEAPRWTRQVTRPAPTAGSSSSPYAPLVSPPSTGPKAVAQAPAMTPAAGNTSPTSYNPLVLPVPAATPGKVESATGTDAAGTAPPDIVPVQPAAEAEAAPGPAAADKSTSASTTQFLKVPLYPPKPNSAGGEKMVADAAKGDMGASPDTTDNRPGSNVPPAADWRASWGKPTDHSSKTAAGLPQARTEGSDPLLKDPENNGPAAADKAGTSPVPASQAGAKGGAPVIAATEAEGPAQKDRKQWGLFNKVRSAFGRNQEKAAETAAVTREPEKTQPVKAAPELTRVDKGGTETEKVEHVKTPVEPEKVEQAKMPPEPEKVPEVKGPTTSGATEDGESPPLGSGSVMAATNGAQGTVHYVPVPVVTLPGSTKPPEAQLPAPPRAQVPEPPQPTRDAKAMWNNAFAGDGGTNPPPYGQAGPMQQQYRHPLQGLSQQPTFGPGPLGGVVLPPTPGTAMSGPGGMSPPPSMAYQRQQQQGMSMGNGMYPPAPPGMYPPMPVQQGMYPPNMPMPMQQGMYPPGMAAPMQPGMYGNNPMAPGMRPMGPGVVPAGYNSPMAPAGYATAMAGNQPLSGPFGPTAQPIPQLVSMMEESLYPSQREWAAENLAAYDWHMHPHVVQALLTAAAKDPAATVRTCCVRTLAKMNVNTVPVITGLKDLKGDTDPRVRQAVEDALVSLVPAKAEK